MVSFGNNFTLMFQVLANFPPYGIQWYFNGTAIRDGDIYQTTNVTQAGNSIGDQVLYNASLVICSVDFNTQGVYVASFSSRGMGIVNTSPIFITPPGKSCKGSYYIL